MYLRAGIKPWKGRLDLGNSIAKSPHVGKGELAGLTEYPVKYEQTRVSCITGEKRGTRRNTVAVEIISAARTAFPPKRGET